VVCKCCGAEVEFGGQRCCVDVQYYTHSLTHFLLDDLSWRYEDLMSVVEVVSCLI
jgi:hypothetical protein